MRVTVKQVATTIILYAKMHYDFPRAVYHSFSQTCLTLENVIPLNNFINKFGKNF